MKIARFIFSSVLIFSWNLLQAAPSLDAQAYAVSNMQKIITITPEANHSIFTLNDGSQWKSIDSTEKLLPAWKVGDRLLIRWNHDLLQYFFHDINHDPSLTLMEGVTEFASMVEAPSIEITGIQDNTIQLSDKNTFVFIPFLGKLEIGNRVLVTLNEGAHKETHPYFLISFYSTINSDTNQKAWLVSGEVQARQNNILQKPL